MKKYLALVAAALLWVSCDKDDDGLNPNPSASVETQDFMWKAMNFWYFWQADVPNLADNAFNSDEEYTNFLQSPSNPEAFIQSLLFLEDRFTFFNEDFNVVINASSGVTKSNGLLNFEVDLTADNTDNLFLFVANVIPGSDAAAKGIKRGDVFYGVDGTKFTPGNIDDLLSTDTYTLNKGELDIENRLVNTTTEVVTLTKSEGLLENPIRLATTLDLNGQKVGYIMYRRFNRDFNEELNNVFGQFLADGVTDLILDLRYNPGGSVNTSRLLASMIYDDNPNDLYIKQRWNDKQQMRFEGRLEDFFANQVESGIPLNTLNLNRVFILGTGNTASAGELLMNGLDPYIEVIHIGTTTRGKNEFSLPLVDDPGNEYVYDESRESNINPDNRWIIQPLVGRNENSIGFSDYTAGFTPDFEQREDVFNLGAFGDPNEPLLAKAIEIITGVTSKAKKTIVFDENIKLKSSDLEIMILDKKLSFD